MKQGTCKVCQSFSGEEAFFPEAVVHETALWRVGHAYNTVFVGWFVADLKRHVEALHDLTDEEFAELKNIVQGLSRALRVVMDTKKEYFAIFAEGEGFQHVHAHIVARTEEFDMQYKGPKCFGLLKSDPEAVAAARPMILELCRKIKEKI